MSAMSIVRRSLIRVVAVVMTAAVAMTCEVAAAGNAPANDVLPPDRATQWRPGLIDAGGIPSRSTVCSTLSPGGGTSDDTARIQAAINVCPIGQVVQLSAGTFLINDGHYLRLN